MRLAIVGGGAKAAAIAAKAACLKAVRKIEIETVIFERARIGANWNGSHGYTDGRQSLCTPAERDLGFPYELATYGDAVASRMQANFSWAAFMVSTERYGDWVDSGRPPPSHREFADYLDFCVKRSKAGLVSGDVVSLDHADGLWRVGYETASKTRRSKEGFDGVVVTGTGPAKRISTFTDRRLFDGRSFWNALTILPGLAAAAPESPIVVLGSGGTAAACAGWLVRAGIPNQIVILGRSPTLFARTDSAFENRVFRDEDAWRSLSFDDRRRFTERLTRGAVWQSVLDVLGRAKNVEVRQGEITSIQLSSPGSPSLSCRQSIDRLNRRFSGPQPPWASPSWPLHGDPTQAASTGSL
ncbi:SidA/IucD/PvdA family monooxygenase [Caulobacter segnis]|nr:SidA/IucD/PvdA family monooxygenase [Caulobacter segnis]